MSSQRYNGFTPWSALNIVNRILKLMRSFTGNQCNCIMTGVIWSYLLKLHLIASARLPLDFIFRESNKFSVQLFTAVLWKWRFFFLASFPARKVAILKCCQLPCVMRRTRSALPGNHLKEATTTPESDDLIGWMRKNNRATKTSLQKKPFENGDCFVKKKMESSGSVSQLKIQKPWWAIWLVRR